jgi:hypothetical protein
LWASVFQKSPRAGYVAPIFYYAIVRRMSQHRLASGPLIARLVGRNRMTINAAMRAGRYGAPIRLGGVLYVDLAAVADFHGTNIDDAQLAAAVAGKPDRLLTMPTPEPETVMEASCAV